MHGNVWEWCLDQWHENYENAPADGSAWMDADDSQTNINKDYRFAERLLRGGSWLLNPGNCRSACRGYYHPDGQLNVVGFRVCCLPQD
jgi:formylglycine-generating enzyme required for sulfatase activity